MERLLDDAEALKAKQGEVAEYSIDSYADIVEAIHVVQTEMGITGTTSQEAATTISGSFSSAKASLENFLVGMVDTEQDIVALGGEAADSIITAFSNVGPAVANFMTVGVRAIEDAVDPANKVERALGDVEKAQARVTNTDNVLNLIARYRELQAEVENAGGSETELKTIEAEMKSVREQLAAATGNATIAQDEYNAALQTTLNGMEVQYQHQKEMLADDLYKELSKSAAAFNETLDEVTRAEQEQTEILETSASMSEYAQKSESDRAKTLQNLAKKLKTVSESAGDGADHTEEFREALDEAEAAIRGISGEEVRFTDIFTAVDHIERMSTDLEIADKNTVSLAERNEGLTETIVSGKSAMAEWLEKAEELIESGFYTAEDAADMLGVSVSELNTMIEQSKETTDATSESTQNLAAAMAEEDAAAQALNQSLANIGIEAYNAITAGGDLRTSYEELTSQVTALNGELDQETLDLVNTALETLNLAATNQELTESYPAFVEAAGNAGIALTDLSAWLIDNGLTAEEWGEQVSSATNNVINDFTEVKTSTGQSVDEMKRALRSNIDAYTSWNTNIANLMAAAVESGDQSKIAFVQSMQDLGIGAADQVAEMATDIDGTLEEFGPMFEEAADAGMLSVYNSIIDKTPKTENAATDAMEAAKKAMLDVDFTPTGEDSVQEFSTGVKAATSQAQSAGTNVANAAKRSAGTVDFTSVGYNMAAGMASGLYSGSSRVTSAARSIAQRAYNAAKASLGIHSPSTVFRDGIGKMITEGMAVGISSPDVIRDIQTASDVVTDSIYANMSRLNTSYTPQIGIFASNDSTATESTRHADSNASESQVNIIINGADYATKRELAEEIASYIYKNVKRQEAALA